MLLLTMSFKASVYHQTEPNVYGDTDHSHTSVQMSTMAVVVQDEHPGNLAMAEVFLRNYGGYRHDPSFEFLGFIAQPIPVTSILYSPTMRL